MRIIFMGTPDFAVESLKALVDAGHDVVCVFTRPDKPKGRKRVLTEPPVKTAARAIGIKAFQPERLRTEETLNLVKGLKPDVIAVAAYGKILPKEILEIPELGCINVHGSLLPKYRGAAPIQWSVINGDEETGITTMLMDEGLDTGAIILKEKTRIDKNETAGDLYVRLSKIGARLLVKTLEGVADGTLKAARQEGEATYAPPLEKSMGELDFKKSALALHNLVRGLNPWPVAYTFIDGKTLKIFEAKESSVKSDAPGKIISLNPLIVGCGGGTSLELREVQLEGKNRISAEAFLRGYKIENGLVLGRGEV